MGKCINVASPEFSKLVEETGIPAIDLAIEISLYQDKNNTDEFPTVEYLQTNTPLPYEEAVQEFKSKYKMREIYPTFEVVKKLIDSARDNSKYDQIKFGVKSSSAGFSVAFNKKYGEQTQLLQQYNEVQANSSTTPELETAVRNYFEAIGVEVKAVDKIYFNGKEIDANAKANTLDLTVEYVEDKVQRDTLPEEAAHIWVDMAGGENNPMIRKMMNDVTKFKIYDEVVRQYSKAYKGNLILLQKEAVGKVIASYMLNQYTGEPTLDELGKSWYERLWTKIKSFFTGNKYKSASLDILRMTKEKADKLQRPTKGSEMFQLEDTQENVEEESENIHQRQYVLFKRRLGFLDAKLKEMGTSDPRYERYLEERDTIKEMFEQAQTDQDYTELGNRTLDKIESYIERLESNTENISAEKIEDTFGVLSAFEKYPGLETRVGSLEGRLFPFTISLALDLVNQYRTEDSPITEEMINAQVDDISATVAGIGALANSSNFIARTVAAMTKAAQNRISVQNKELTRQVQEEIDKLTAWGKQNGMTLQQVYNLFIQERFDTLTLVTKKNEDGSINANWQKVMTTPELKAFYDFYVKQTGLAGIDTHTKTAWTFIPNIPRKKSIIEKWKAEDLETEEFQTQLSEELFADLVSNKAYRSKLKADDKSTDLGEAILKYRAFGIKYKEMSQVLPQARILQKQLEKKRTKSGAVVDRQFRKSSDPSVTVLGVNSNRWKMVNTYIDMQIKGKMKGEQSTTTKAIDQLLSYNSLLKIGFSPITAISNVIFGDLSNLIEAVGGRFYTVKDIHKASTIFAKETYDMDSKMNLLLELINPLQELTDYENISKVRIAKKLSPERIKEIMYAPQKMGEKWLQTRTMIALMLHEKIKTKDGKTEVPLWEIFEVVKDDKGKAEIKIKEGFEFNEKQIEKLRDKIQRLNEMIHGRYSSRDAANLSQNVLYRMAAQFRKWIPTQIENRIQKQYFDSRLGVMIEGRYHTFGRTVLKEFKNKQVGKAFSNMFLPLINAKKALERGELSEMEIYNLRKMMVEIILAAASLLTFAAIAGGDDDEKKKDPLIKFGLTLLNRASNDLIFFYSAREINKLGTNSIPLAKTTGDILDAILVIPEVIWTGETTISRGSNKGRYKIEKEFVDVVPILNPIFGQMRRIFSENALEELN